jgi:transcriptional regulator with XRE-family HTH domain
MLVRDNIEKVRKAKGLTKTFVGKQVGLTCQGYRHITTGSVRLSVDYLLKIADVLDVPPAVLLSDELTDRFIQEQL